MITKSELRDFLIRSMKLARMGEILRDTYGEPVVLYQWPKVEDLADDILSEAQDVQ